MVTADPSGLSVPVGAEVLTINGVPAPDMLGALMPYARADGHNDAKRAALLGVTGIETIEYFDVFHGLVFGAPAGGSHRVVLRRTTGEEARLELPAMGLAERQAQMRTGDYTGGDPFWDWKAVVQAFSTEMEHFYSLADVVISRSGAASLTELSHYSLPAVLIPYPAAADDHQSFNARIFERAGAARILVEGKTSPEELHRCVMEILDDAPLRQKMAEASGQLAGADAAKRVAEEIEASCHQN